LSQPARRPIRMPEIRAQLAPKQMPSEAHRSERNPNISASTRSVFANSLIARLQERQASGFGLSGFTAPETLTAGQSLTLTVAFTPTLSGTSTGAVTFASDAYNPTLSVSLSGTRHEPGATDRVTRIYELRHNCCRNRSNSNRNTQREPFKRDSIFWHVEQLCVHFGRDDTALHNSRRSERAFFGYVLAADERHRVRKCFFCQQCFYLIYHRSGDWNRCVCHPTQRRPVLEFEHLCGGRIQHLSGNRLGWTVHQNQFIPRRGGQLHRCERSIRSKLLLCSYGGGLQWCGKWLF
jgi:hypothetical protein